MAQNKTLITAEWLRNNGFEKHEVPYLKSYIYSDDTLEIEAVLHDEERGIWEITITYYDESTGYKVGDVVEAHFTHYWGGGKNVHYDWKRGKGTIIRLENGEIRIKSLDKYGKSEEVSDCPDGSLRRSHWHVFEDFVIEKIDNIILN